MFGDEENEDLFGSYAKSRINYKMVLVALTAFVLLSGAGYLAYSFTKPAPRPADDIVAEEIRNSMVAMLHYHTFSGEEFRQQVLGKGRLERYVRATDDTYFTYPPAPQEEIDQFLDRFFYDKKKIDFGKTEGENVKLGDYSAPTSYASQLFRTPLANIKMPREQTLSFPYSTTTYTLSLEELNNFVNNNSVHGGHMIAQQAERTNRPKVIFGNHAIMVAKPNEPSLTRLTDALLKDVDQTREARIQRLVDFVSNEIDYSYSEALGTGETLKRPDETLMTRNGDCSNKTILLASLLEQINEPYILLYCEHHITVGVPQGAFPDMNKLSFDWDDKKWMIAETTLPGFQVGKTKVIDPQLLQLVQYVQDPVHYDSIIDAQSNEVIKFW